MKKVRLSEVFLVHQQPMNIGRKKVVFESDWQPKNEAAGQLKPELQKVLKKHAAKIYHELGLDSVMDKADNVEGELEQMLADFAHELEGAEGEDPAELDKGGPKPGTTGGK